MRAFALISLLLSLEGTAGTASFPNEPQVPGQLLAGLIAPSQGRTAIIAIHNGVIFTIPEVPSSNPGSDFQVRSWDLADPTNPVELNQWGITPMPIMAHGYFKEGDYLQIGPNDWSGGGDHWSFVPDLGPQRVVRAEFPNWMCAGERGCLYQPWFASSFWSYSDVSGNALIRFGDFQPQNVIADWDHLGETGVIGHPFIVGNLLIYASDQSRSGIAIYDISDPANPTLLDAETVGGAGGYWPELWGGDGQLYVVFPYRNQGNGMRVFDISDPHNITFVADTSLPGDEAMYAQFQDEYAFIGSHKIDMRTFQSVVYFDPNQAWSNSYGSGTRISTSQFALPIGNLLVTGGAAPDQGMAIWAHQADPDLRGPHVGFHIPRAGQQNYPVGSPITLLIHETLESPTIVNGISFIVRPLGGDSIAGRLVFAFDDTLTFTPDQPLEPDTTYEVILPAGGIEDAAGNGMEPYSFSFSTGPTVGGNQPPVATSLIAEPYPVAPMQPVNIEVTAFDPDLDALEFRYDFGDGTPRTAWGPSQQVAHAYAAPGHYKLLAQVRDSAAALDTVITTVTVLSDVALTANHSTPIQCAVEARRVHLVNPDNNTITAIDADNASPLYEIPTCLGPKNLAVGPNDTVWVACADSDEIFIHNAQDGALIESVPLHYGNQPWGIAMSPDLMMAYVTLYGSGELLSIETLDPSAQSRLTLGPTPRAISVNADGTQALITRFISPTRHAEIWDVDLAGPSLARTLTIAKFGGDTNADSSGSGRGVANYSSSILHGAAPDTVWMTANKSNFERGLLVANDLDDDNTVRNLLIELRISDGSVLRAIDIDNSDSALGLALSPLGDYLLLALRGNDELAVFDTLQQDSAGLGGLVARLSVGSAPQGVCADASTGDVWIKNLMSRDATRLSMNPFFQHGDISVESDVVSTVEVETLGPQVLAGKRLFHHASDPRMSAEGYLSCESCHADGGQDGRVWDFTGRGEGLRNTITLRGRSGMGHGNVHWSANFDEIQDFENDIRGAFAGAGFLSDADFAATQAPLGPPKSGLSAELDALAAYVVSLGEQTLPRSPFRQQDGTFSSEAVSGYAVFSSLACDQCHSQPNFTDSTVGAGVLHDVGTLRTTSGQRLAGPLPGIDTPSLLGVFATGPYLHDGSAPDLVDVFTSAGGVVLPAESAELSGGAQLSAEAAWMWTDDTHRGRRIVELQDQGATMQFALVDGGMGGIGEIELRYSAGFRAVHTVAVDVNGVTTMVQLPNSGNDPQWALTQWHTVRVPNLVFAPSTANTVQITVADASPYLGIDEVLISSPDDLLMAQPHRQVTGLPDQQRIELLAFLNQLDGRDDEVLGEQAIFANGFE